MTHADAVIATALIGCGATLGMDLWLLVLKRLGVPVQGFAMVGRWVAHMTRGTFTHAAIGKAQPVRGELWLGWITHYAVGIAFAFLLVGAVGAEWLREPTVWPALAFGLASVAAPLFIMQPAMGAGFAARRTAAPWRAGLRSLANHMVFGASLYVSARALAWLMAGERP